jgi:hypothetical protein
MAAVPGMDVCNRKLRLVADRQLRPATRAPCTGLTIVEVPEIRNGLRF